MEETLEKPAQEERTWAMLAHLGALIASLVSGGLAGFAVPLVIYLVKRDESAFVADQAKEALNFRITLFLAYIVLVPVTLVMILTTFGLGICLAIPLMVALYLFDLVFGILASIRSYDGELYRYPYALRLVQ